MKHGSSISTFAWSRPDEREPGGILQFHIVEGLGGLRSLHVAKRQVAQELMHCKIFLSFSRVGTRSFCMTSYHFFRLLNIF